MDKRTSAATRITAALALIAAVVVIVVVAATAMNGSDSSSPHRSKQHTQKEKRHRTKAKTYTVQTGDTLTAIAHRTGVPVAEILALNPEVDPQILIAGQTLKLK
ncbi:MAG TPA: LysM domain-containing protein [Solirubrobacterales bacterium]|jgi:LysM repeat protein|nr:LysM domain-containing protein [Solirubrobacterales bacterium]